MVTAEADVLRAADKIVLPGVGHFDQGMQKLDELQLRPILEELALVKRIPLLGICLGMQMMCKSSEEGETSGLGWMDASVHRFDAAQEREGRKVPHMGWNMARATKNSPLFDVNPPEPNRFYFVHSYFVRPANPDDVLTVTPYGTEFCSAFAHGNLWGVQFHPEKSHGFGMNLFRRFLQL